MRTRRNVIGSLAGAAAAMTLGPPIARAVGDPLARLLEGSRALIMRHALAPGVGDPPGFRLDECATQRNLNGTGRAQARALGRRLATLGVREPRILSSRWCRARETAELLGLGPVEPFPPLDSFFERPGERDPSTAALRAFLAGLPQTGRPVIMVTHQVNITALTGVYPGSGEALVLRLVPGAGPEVEARVPVEA